MNNSLLNLVKLNRAIAIQCIILFMLSITVTLVVARWRNRPPAITDGFDFTSRRNTPSAGPKIAETISFKTATNQKGQSLPAVAAGHPLYMIAVVDPHCSACKAAQSQMAEISKRLSTAGIPVFLLMLTNVGHNAEYFEYAGSMGLASQAFIWRTDLAEPPKSLAEMVVPSHLLLSRDGFVVDK